MTSRECIELLGEWEGYVIGTVGRVNPSETMVEDEPEAWIELLPDSTYSRCCSECGRGGLSIHDSTERWVRDLPILGMQTWLLIYRVRVACPDCGPKVEQLDWLGRYGRVTKRLTQSVARLCRVLPIKHVAEHFGLGWDAVKAIDKTYLQETLGEVDLSGVEQIVMDEFAIQKGHRYATVIVEAHTKRVLWVCRGRSREDIRPFFERLGQDGRNGLKAVAIDMNGAYEEEVRYQCPFAEIVYDLFHVVVKFGREVIDRVRVDEANRLKHDKPARKVIKGSRWLLLRNAENVPQKDRVRLEELLSANRKLMTVYLLKDDLKHLWNYKYPAAARRFWKQWYNRAIRSRIEPLKKFARNLKKRIDGVISHCRWPLHTSLIEGINNKIKVIKRMAYGYRDDEYFFLKIRQAFPGIPG